ncbi:MAG: threonine synthase [Armatimonadetes bacterium]|nr:threonine synthase [Armatimonadota bacterium]MDW8028447.1 threonine synthase [Armatimonadota bacterium]
MGCNEETQRKKMRGLKCRECGAYYPLEALHVCEFCFGPLEVDYDYDYLRTIVSRERIESGPPNLWRYIDLLPISSENLVDSGTGLTPLLKAERLGERLGLRNLFIKNDTSNPTWSFKDRVVSVAITKAMEFGFDTVSCASTGNLGNSVAAHAARTGLRCFIFIPADLELGKIVGSLVYNPTLVAVRGNYDEVNRLCAEIASTMRWGFVNINLRPYYAEGSKTLGFEVVEQLGWQAPDHIVVPMASGSLLTKVWKALKELHRLRLIDEVQTKVHGAQAEGCSPIVRAFKENSEFVRPVKPKTIVKSLAIGNPADGIYALQAMRESGGVAEMVTDDEVVEGIKLLAETEGIFTETAGGVTIGVLKKLIEQGIIGSDETVVALITGCGLKTQEVLTDRIAQPVLIEPNLRSFQEKFAELAVG